MFNKLKSIVAPAALLAISGCVTPVPKYVAPPREAAADLEFAAAGLKSFYFHENGENCTETRKLSAKEDPLQGGAGVLAVPAEKRIALTLMWGELSGVSTQGFTVTGCSVIISFQLQTGRRYRLVGGADKSGCAVDIVDVQGGVSAKDSIRLKQMKHVQTADSLMFGSRASTCAVQDK